MFYKPDPHSATALPKKRVYFISDRASQRH